MSVSGGGSPRHHDVFLSYSHGADGRLAPAVQRAVERLGARWPQTRALRVFRDTTGLSADSSLWGAIETALDGSAWFLLLASPDAAASPWVERELEHWLDRNPPERLLIVVTDGDLSWDSSAGELRGSAVPATLRGRFADEPRHVDLRWARSDFDLDLHHARFRDAIAELAAPVHGVPKDELESDHVRERRRTRRLTRLTIVALTVLAMLSTVLAGAAWRQTSEARQQATLASAQALAVRSQQLVGTRPDLAGLYAAESVRLDDRPSGRAALIESVNADPLLQRIVPIEDPEVPVVLSADGELVVTQRPGGLVVRQADDGSAVTSIELSEDAGLPTTTERAVPPTVTIPDTVPPGQPSPAPAPTAPEVGTWDLVAVDSISDHLAVAGATGDPTEISVWPLRDDTPGSADPEVFELGTRVTELAWVTEDTLLVRVDLSAPREGPPRLGGQILMSSLRLIDLTAGTVNDVHGVDPMLEAANALAVSSDSGRFLAHGPDRVLVMDHRGEPIEELPRPGYAPHQLTPDGTRFLRAYFPEVAGPTSSPTLQLVDLASGAVVWELPPSVYEPRFEGLEFGNAVASSAQSLRLAMSADGGRILVENWMVGADLDDQIVRMDPIGTDSPAWPTVSPPRSLAMTGDGNRITRLVRSGIAHATTEVLLRDLDCSELTDRLPRLPVETTAGSAQAPCAPGDVPSIPLGSSESTLGTATASPDGRHVAVFTTDSADLEMLPQRLLLFDVESGRMSEVDLHDDDTAGVGSLGVTLIGDVAVLQQSVDRFNPVSGETGLVEDFRWYDLEDGSLRTQRSFAGPAWLDPERDRVVGSNGNEVVVVDLDVPDEETATRSFPNEVAGIEVVDGFVVVTEAPSTTSTVLTPDLGRVVTTLEPEESLAAASRDGARIAIRSGRGVTVLDTSSSEALTRIDGSDPGEVEFIGTGVAVAFDTRLEYLELRTGARSVLAAIDPRRDLGVELLVADGDELLALSGDGIRRYQVAGDLETVACRRAGRPLTIEEWRAAAAVGSPRACS